MRLNMGEEFLSRVTTYEEDGETYLKLTKPMKFALVPTQNKDGSKGEPQLTLVPWLLHADGTDFELNANRFVFCVNPQKELVQDYNRSTAHYYSGITMPPSNQNAPMSAIKQPSIETPKLTIQ